MPWLFGAEVLRPNAGPRRAGCVSDVRRGVRVARSGRSQDRKARLDEEPRREVVLIETSETMTQKFLVLVASAVLLWTPRGAAQERTPASLVVTAQNVTAETAGRMNKTVAQPGDEIRYTLVFTNVTAAPVKNVQFVDPIPSGLVYVLGSATSAQPARIEYSIDGGKTYSVQPMIDAVENGRKVAKPAPREMYTHVRWTVVGSAAPGAQVTAELRAQVSAAPGEAK